MPFGHRGVVMKKTLKEDITESIVMFQLLEVALHAYVLDLYEEIKERTKDVMNFKIPSLDKKTLGQLVHILGELDDGNVFVKRLKSLIKPRNSIAHAAFSHMILNNEEEVRKIESNIKGWIKETHELASEMSQINTQKLQERYELSLKRYKDTYNEEYESDEDIK